MAFSWVESIVTGTTYIKASHPQELQTNIDWLADNRGCGANNSVDDTSANGTVDTGDDVTINATADSGYDNGDDGSVYSSACGVVDTGEQSVINSVADSPYCEGDNVVIA